MGESPLTLRPATERDRDAIIYLLDEAAAWLRTQGTDQWARPWRDKADRRERISRDLRAGKTWILENGAEVVATFTADTRHNHPEIPVWPSRARQDPAVYVCRLAVSRSYEGQRLGAALLDWIGLTARDRDGSEWIRVDVWTTNFKLHSYYQEQGFELYDYSQDRKYPSGALFQKSTEGIDPEEPEPFHVADPSDPA